MYAAKVVDTVLSHVPSRHSSERVPRLMLAAPPDKHFQSHTHRLQLHSSTYLYYKTHPLFTLRLCRPPSSAAIMSTPTLTLSDLTYISREDLASTLSTAPLSDSSSLAVVDVRDSDHIGGHIRGSTWVPSSTLDYKTPELVRSLKDKDTVVFHCVLSQQRGPGAALRYLREKERVDGLEKKEDAQETGEGAKEGKGKKQKVLVLRGGFEKWQETYGSDEKLTEGWEKDIWEYGTPGH
jgi:rhodanese-related sulfurtransferase